MPFPKNKYNDYSWIKGSPEIGDETWVGPFCIIDGTGGLSIGKGCDISAGTHIYTHSTVRRCVSGKKFQDGRINRDLIDIKPVSIGNSTFIGPHSVISYGVTIGNNCIIAANSFVNTDIPDNCVYACTPAIHIGNITFDDSEMQINYF